MATIAVVTSSPPFAEGGHLVMARELVRALREEGHDTGLVITPQNRFGQQGSAYLAAWCTDVQLAHEERNEVRAAYNRAQLLDRRRAVFESWGELLVDRPITGL